MNNLKLYNNLIFEKISQKTNLIDLYKIECEKLGFHKEELEIKNNKKSLLDKPITAIVLFVISIILIIYLFI